MLGSGADPGPACAGTRASAAAAGTQADAPEGDAGRAPAPVPPRPTAGHAQSPRGAAGPLRRARRPPRGPARREVCARGAPLFVRFPGGGGGERVRRGAPPGTASCAPSRAPRPRFYTERGERRLCGAGRAGAGTLPRRALGPLRSVSLRAGRAMPPRARARSASLFWRRRARCAPCARFAGRAPQTMKPCGRRRGRASPGDRAVRGRPRGWGAAAPECAPGPPEGRAHGRPGGSRTGPTENDQGQWMSTFGRQRPYFREHEGVPFPARSPGAVWGKGC